MRSAIIFLSYLLALTPLIVMKSLFFPYISGKNLFIRIIITVLWVFFSILIFRSKSFRDDIVLRIKALSRNILFIFTSLFVFLTVVSTFFATDLYRAFFGDIERAEGLLNILFFFSIFVLLTLIFGKKEWITFFKVFMFSGVILFIDSLSDFLSGTPRPGSFLGNPIYSAQTFLFSILASLLVYLFYTRDENTVNLKRKGLWKVVSIIVFIFSVLGIFITETRGVIAGLIIGFFVSLLYFIFKRTEEANNGKGVIKKVSLSILLLVVVFSGVFFSTKSSSFWQSVPGLDRLSEFTLEDPSTQTRLISLGVSLEALNPVQNGYDKLLFGWGPDNFSIAYNKYYNPEYYKYEHSWFDRAHNKLMDVLVMNGVFGLLAYVGLWFSLFWILLKKKFSYENGLLLFFGVAYFFQNLFVFDSIAIYVLFFSFLSYVVFSTKGDETCKDVPSLYSKIILFKSGLISLFLLFALIAWTFIPFLQMKSYINLIAQNLSIDEATKQLEGSLVPYTYAQEVIRTHLLGSAKDLYEGKESQKDFLLFAISLMKDVVNRGPYNPRHMISIGQGYDKLGQVGLVEYYKDAEEYYRKALMLAPERQDIRYLLIYNLSYQKRYNEAIELAEETIRLAPDIGSSHLYLGMVLVASSNDSFAARALSEFEKAWELGGMNESDKSQMIDAVYLLLRYFYNQEDKDMALRSAQLLRELRPDITEGINSIIEYINDETWVYIDFRQ